MGLDQQFADFKAEFCPRLWGGHAARYEANIEPLWASFAASGSHFSQNSPSVTERSAPLF